VVLILKLYEKILKVLIEQESNTNLLSANDIYGYLAKYSISDIEISMRMLVKRDLVIYAESFTSKISIKANKNGLVYFVEKQDSKSQSWLKWWSSFFSSFLSGFLSGVLAGFLLAYLILKFRLK
jgi:hypothetical protein